MPSARPPQPIDIGGQVVGVKPHHARRQFQRLWKAREHAQPPNLSFRNVQSVGNLADGEQPIILHRAPPSALAQPARSSARSSSVLLLKVHRAAPPGTAPPLSSLSHPCRATGLAFRWRCTYPEDQLLRAHRSDPLWRLCGSRSCFIRLLHQQLLTETSPRTVAQAGEPALRQALPRLSSSSAFSADHVLPTCTRFPFSSQPIVLNASLRDLHKG